MKIPLFDIDGTLLEITDEVNQIAYRYAFKKVYGLDAGKDDARTAEGRVQNQVFIDVLKFHGLTEDEILPKLPQVSEALADKFIEAGKNFEFKVLPGAYEIMKTIKSMGGSIGVLTGNNERIAKFKLQKASLLEYVGFGSYGQEAFVRWDLVEIARKRAEVLLRKPVKTDELVIIGDTPNDLKTAEETGIKSIIVTTGIHDEEVYKNEKPDLIVSSLEEKRKILDFLKNG